MDFFRQSWINRQSLGRRFVDALLPKTWGQKDLLPVVRRFTWAIAALWLVLVSSAAWLLSQQIVNARLAQLSANTEYETRATARVIDRLFIEMFSVANMVAQQAQVIDLAVRYRSDPPEAAALTREQRAAQFTTDPLVRKVGDFMHTLASDLGYARIYMNNLSDDTVTASNWAADDSIVGMIYTGRTYLINALRNGNGHSFGIARLNRSPSYFVSSRIDNADDVPQGSVTVKFDAPDMALYLTGQHTALVVNSKGRVTTASASAFMLRNVAALLPPETIRPLEDDEEPGEAVAIRPLELGGASPYWWVDGAPYLVQRQALSNTQYQLLTLASLDFLKPLRQQHVLVALLTAALGVVLIVLAGQALGKMLVRRQEERNEALQTSALNRSLSAELIDTKAKDRHRVEVLGYIGHDLRAPLATISGYSDLLLAEAPIEQHKLLQTIQRSVQYQLALIDEMVEYARAELQPLQIQPSTTDLLGLLDEVSDFATALCLHKSNRFHCECQERLPQFLHLDGKRLKQVLLNLLSNAAKFTHNGEVGLSVQARQQEGVCTLDFAVRDTGVGIDLNRGVDMFAAFQQIQAANGGSGLGLFITQHILTAMGASLRVSSKSGQGSVFSFTLQVPLAGEEGLHWPAAVTKQAKPAAAEAFPVVVHNAVLQKQALKELSHLASLGSYTDIELWIARHTNPVAHAAFTAVLRELLERFDFHGIRMLALQSSQE